MQEQTFTAKNGVQVKYKYKPGKYDFNHIIFVFTGFKDPLPGKYDFTKILNDCPCDVIWINDDFEGMYSYYLCINMDFKVESAVSEFMNEQIYTRKTMLQNITVTGASKGGTAALYYGLKLGIENIVISVPQIYIGSNVDLTWKRTAQHMMGKNYTQSKIQYLDNLIPHLLKKDEQLKRNIYLLTSEVDVQYKVHIEPILSDLSKYENFNLLKTYSLFVRKHNQVTPHHISLLLSIYYALVSEAPPRFKNGKVNFFGSQPAAISKPTFQPYVDLRQFDIVNNRIYIEGVALLRGVSIEKYADINYQLLIKGKDVYSKDLAKADRPNLTKEFFTGELIIYDKCWFTTLNYNGVDMSDISKGQYELFIRITVRDYKKDIKIVSSKSIRNSGNNFSIESDNDKNKLVIK